MPASRAQQADVADRRAKLVRMRLAGISFEQIARDPTLGYASRQAASKDFIRTLRQRRDEQAAEVSVYRQQENERLDELLQAVWPDATGGEPRAVEIVLKLMDRRAKLNGLDMPTQNQVTGADGAPLFGSNTLAELHHLIGAAGEPEANQGQERSEDSDADASAP